MKADTMIEPRFVIATSALLSALLAGCSGGGSSNESQDMTLAEVQESTSRELPPSNESIDDEHTDETDISGHEDGDHTGHDHSGDDHSHEHAQPPSLENDVLETVRPGERPEWWLDAPLHERSEIKVTAEGRDGSLVVARRRAVESGSAALTRARGSEPPVIQFIKTSVMREPSGDYRVFILMSCDE